MSEEEFLRLVLLNPANAAILERLPQLGLADCWLVSGALLQTVWNLRSGQPPAHGILDYDIFYFDEDTSWEAEDRTIARGHEIFADLGVLVQIRNQARVHLWYEKKFAMPYPPLTRATDGIDRFLMTCSQVGVRRSGDGLELYAPAGLEDLAAMVVRPNRAANFHRGRFLEKALRWQAAWPQATILD